MLNLEQVGTLVNGLKSWTLDEIKESKADLGPLADEFSSFKEQVQDTISNAAPKIMMVMRKEHSFDANYNSLEIYNHVISGGTAVFRIDSVVLPLIGFDKTFSTFAATVNNENSIGTIGFTVYEDGHIEVEEKTSNAVYIINLGYSEDSPSCSAESIIDMSNSGYLVLLKYKGLYLNLTSKSSEGSPYPSVTFQQFNYWGGGLSAISITIDYENQVFIDVYDSLPIGVSSVNGQSGDVELTAEDVGALTEEELSEMGFLTSEDAVTDSPVPFDADTLNGYNSEYFASKDYVVDIINNNDSGIWKPIVDVVYAEDGVMQIEANQFIDGSPLECKQLNLSIRGRVLNPAYAFYTVYASDNKSGSKLKTVWTSSRLALSATGGEYYISTAEVSVFGGVARGIGVGSQNDASSSLMRYDNAPETIRYVKIVGLHEFAAGARVTLWGRN